MANCPISRAILGVENSFRDLVGSFPEGEAMLKITDDGKAMQWIQSSPDWESVSHTLRARIDGMELLPIGDSGRNPFLPLIEELTTNTSLPLPLFDPPCNSNIPFADCLVQLFAELALSLMKLASFMIKNPTDDTWLLVYDNLDDVQILRKFWPDRGKGHIIVTSRNPYTASFRACASISVLPLNMEESVKLFYNEISWFQLPQRNLKIEKLLGDWKGVPLAIN
ncbi:uncharacterized protein F5Z01DRAFT_736660 [Emericellopsis atlantica]|uniref:NB-ARC domain-containing protein n=1 Tax=Emericellopsis atlantica TaxID=2614577 RepID=A0A9P7ZLY5_9HYPO|nr:uncharacterized protein F5Z01DRAFT_736660 [Emericellopsis atlantica]KAG9254381.1 hypothetical protein F5Z01DRAFT_736660 [Emericellopsis atlantica]